MAERSSRVLGCVLDHPWAITHAYRPIIANALARHLSGDTLDAETSDAIISARAQHPAPVPPRQGATLVLPVHGVLVPRASLMTEVSGVLSLDELSARVTDAANDDRISAIVLDVDSPGGNVAGCLECASALRDARAKKPIVAQARYLMASAAYWVASQCSEVVASPSARVGGIGVFTIHDDLSAALKQLGINRTYLFRGEHKVDGNETAPLTDETKAELLATVDHWYEAFVADVARGRNVDASAVRDGYGQGRAVDAQRAQSLGMVDRVATLDATLARLATSPPTTTRLAAQHAPPSLAADAVWMDGITCALLEQRLQSLENRS